MGLLDSLSPGQAKILMIGVPVAGAAALWSIHKKSAAPSSGTTNPTVMPSTQVIGAGQLAEFEQGLTDAYNSLASTVMTLKLDPPKAPAPPPPQIVYVHDLAVPVSAPPPPPPVDQGPPPVITNVGPVYNQQPAAGVPAPGEPAQWASGVPADWYTDIPKPLWW